ncbi:MAG: 3-hydroxyacyl-ACP dehydratase FabZ [Isosphaeraceae bacterium]
MQTLPNRYPHLLIDRVIEVEPGRRVYAEKRVGNGEPFFNGRRQGRPVMPGMMVLEALAQTAAVMIAEHVGRSGKHAVITALDQVTSGAPVVPGDLLGLEVSCLALQPNRAAARGVATVDGRFAAEAKIQFVLVDADRSAA